jgi:Contractile injection system tape measure protein
VFANVSSPDRILRIDTLEIDLGEVPLDELEHALSKKFEAAFARELTAAISHAQRASGTAEDVTLASQLELAHRRIGLAGRINSCGTRGAAGAILQTSGPGS